MAEESGQSADLKVGATRNRGNKARMYMKTKEEVKKSRSCEARSRGQARRCVRVDTLRLSTLDSQLLDSNSTEQSENVYENKGPASPASARGHFPIGSVADLAPQRRAKYAYLSR